MFSYDELIAKTKLYFLRADERSEGDPEQALWLLLGMEFLLRAPLARIHPTLLADPEGDGILLAAGVSVAKARPRSISMSTVLKRLQKIDADFGQDKALLAAELTELRNSELHTSDSPLDNIHPSSWMPSFLSVIEGVCAHLHEEASSFLPSDILDAATAYRNTDDQKVKQRVVSLLQDCKTFYNRLSATERDVRRATAAAEAIGTRKRKYPCPACNEWAVITLSPGRSKGSRYDEDDATICYTMVSVVLNLDCAVCGLSLANTAEVMASGIDRLDSIDYSEDRYEGWQDVIPDSEIADVAMEYLADSDYGNE